MDYRCINCQINAFTRLLSKNEASVEEKNILFKDFLGYLSELDFTNKIAPEIAKKAHDKIKEKLNVKDLYFEEKQEINELLLNKYQELKEKISNSENPFITALKMSIAGNIIDIIGSPDSDIDKTVEMVLNSDFAVDDSILLNKMIKKAKTILYLGDNAGEIVMDKLFIEHINHKNIYYAVRGGAVLNDATINDANFVQMDKVAKVISNGHDAPSTIIKECSAEFQAIFNNADLIISKGMGNLEALLGSGNNKIIFLSMIKCDIIAELTGVSKGDFIVMQEKTK